MNRFTYNLTITILSPILLAWMAWRARRAGGNWQVLSAERFGRYPQASTLRRPVWVHAVSLGETRAVQPFVQALLDQGESVLLTHLTATGRAEGQRLFADEIAAGQLVQQWMPYDFAPSTRRFIRHYQPRAGVLMEREVWPNLIAAARAEKVPMLLASARFSDQALRQSLRLGRVMQQAYASFHAVYAQTLQDAQRLEQAGAVAPSVSGNFKFDVTLPMEQIRAGHEHAEMLGRKVIAIASTREGEDESFVQAIRHVTQRAQAQGRHLEDEYLFLLIPRHPQRFDLAANLLEEAGLSYVRRSSLIQSGLGSAGLARACENALVLLGDTLGEMPRYYATSDVAIVGGSFERLGGQNFIEACAIGVPVIVGPHTRNFQQAVQDAIDEGAAVRVADASLAVTKALELLEDGTVLARMSEAGTHWVKKHTGAVQRVMTALDKLT